MASQEVVYSTYCKVTPSAYVDLEFADRRAEFLVDTGFDCSCISVEQMKIWGKMDEVYRSGNFDFVRLDLKVGGTLYSRVFFLFLFF